MSTFKPGIAIPVGETLKEVIEDRGITVNELSKGIQLSEELTNGLLIGMVRVTPALAIKLDEFLKIPKSFWMNLERNYNETLLRVGDETEEINESK
jgi:HTH-type transcriptional regulator/antitoxin HigA